MKNIAWVIFILLLIACSRKHVPAKTIVYKNILIEDCQVPHFLKQGDTIFLKSLRQYDTITVKFKQSTGAGLDWEVEFSDSTSLPLMELSTQTVYISENIEVLVSEYTFLVRELKRNSLRFYLAREKEGRVYRQCIVTIEP